MLPFTTFAIAVAPVPPPPVKVTVGVPIRPEPGFTTAMFSTDPVAVAAAPVPPPPAKLTEGIVVYPVPPEITLTLVTLAPPGTPAPGLTRICMIVRVLGP